MIYASNCLLSTLPNDIYAERVFLGGNAIVDLGPFGTWVKAVEWSFYQNAIDECDFVTVGPNPSRRPRQSPGHGGPLIDCAPIGCELPLPRLRTNKKRRWRQTHRRPTKREKLKT